MSRPEQIGKASRLEAKEPSIIGQGAQVLADLSERSQRAEMRNRVRRYLRRLLASVERKNGWVARRGVEEATGQAAALIALLTPASDANLAFPYVWCRICQAPVVSVDSPGSSTIARVPSARRRALGTRAIVEAADGSSGS